MSSRASHWLGVCCTLFLIGILAMSTPLVRGYVSVYLLVPTAGARGDRNWWDAKIVLGDFFVRSLAKDYDAAHQLLSTRMQGATTVKDLQAQWQAFEIANGGIRNWRALAARIASRSQLTSGSKLQLRN